MQVRVFIFMLTSLSVTQANFAAADAGWKKIAVPGSQASLLIKDEKLAHYFDEAMELVIDISQIDNIMDVVHALKTYEHQAIIVRIRFTEVHRFDELKSIECHIKNLGFLRNAEGLHIMHNEIVIAEPVCFDSESGEADTNPSEDASEDWPDDL